MSRIFISYAHEDRDLALKLYRDLQQADLHPWIDVEELLGGQDWRVAVGEAIRSSSYFLALISKNSVSKRGYVQKELRDAIDIFEQVPPDQIYLVPIRLDDTEPLGQVLRALHWIDFFPSYPRGLARLLRSLAASSKKVSEPRSTALPEAIQPRAERDHPDVVEVATSRRDAILKWTSFDDDGDACTLDESGICTNQMHWGANE